MGRWVEYSLDGSWVFESPITPSLTVMTEFGHAKFTDGRFVTYDAALAEALLASMSALPGVGLSTRPAPVVESEPDAVAPPEPRTFWRRFTGRKVA